MQLAFENLRIGYQDPLLETPFTLCLDPSTITLLIGNNGCGKTTLIKTIARLCPPLSGNINYNQQNIRHISDHDYPRYFSFLFTMRPFLMQHTIMDVIALGRSPYMKWNAKLSPADVEIIQHYAEILGIQHLLHQPADKVSDGQLQKALIAKTLVQQSPIIVLDEPLSFLDYSSKKIILQTLKDIASKERKMVVLSTHDIHLSMNYADKVIFMHQRQWIYNTTEDMLMNEVFRNFIDIKN